MNTIFEYKVDPKTQASTQDIPEKHAENTKRDEEGKWLAGTSGNPNGRPKKGLALTDLIRNIFDSDEEKPKKIVDKLLYKDKYYI